MSILPSPTIQNKKFLKLSQIFSIKIRSFPISRNGTADRYLVDCLPLQKRKSKTIITEELIKRMYAAQAAEAVQTASTASALEVSASEAGIKLASQDNGSSLARVVCAVKAGARYEAYNQRGACAYIRSTAELTQDHAYAVAVTKDVQQCGGNIKCTASRENILYTLEAPRDTAPHALNYLIRMLTEHQFRPWELDACSERINYEKLRLTEQPENLLMEKIHALAYRNHGMANSLYTPEFNDPNLTGMLTEYIKSNFTTDRIAVSALNVSSKHLKSMCSQLNVGRQSFFTPQEKPTFYSGESRDNSFEMMAYTTIAGEGASVIDKDVWAYAVLEQILGAPENIKRSSNIATSLLNKTISAKTDQPFSVRCFSANYSDTGLFGVNIVSVPENSDLVVRSVVDTLRSVGSMGLSEQLEGAKQRVKAALAFSAERWGEMVENQALELNAMSTVSNLTESMKAVDSVKQSDVQDAAKKVVSKLCMASRGEINNVPYLDSL